MKYPLEYKTINNAKELIAQIELEENAYKAKVEELKSKGEEPAPSLYAEYHFYTAKVISSFLSNITKNYARKFVKFLNEPEYDKTRKSYTYTKENVLIAMENGKYKNVLSILKHSKTLVMLNQDIKAYADFVKREYGKEKTEAELKEEAIDSEKNKESAMRSVQNVQHHRVSHLQPANAMDAAEAVNNNMDGDKVNFKPNKNHQTKTILNTVKNTDKTIIDGIKHGKEARLYSSEKIDGKYRDRLGNIEEVDEIDPDDENLNIINEEESLSNDNININNEKNKNDNIISTDQESEEELIKNTDPREFVPEDFSFNNTGYDAVKENMEIYPTRLDNFKHDKDLYAAYGLNLIKNLSYIHEHRGFWKMVFHPFKYMDESDLISDLRADMVRNGVDPADIDAAKKSNTDYVKEYMTLNNLVLPKPIEKIDVEIDEDSKEKELINEEPTKERELVDSLENVK